MLRVLSNGRLVEVPARGGPAAFVVCDWLVEVPEALFHAPEEEWYPDFPSDVYRVVECGARVSSTDGSDDHTVCDAGHHRIPYAEDAAPGGPAWESEARERFAETGSVFA